MATLKTPEGKQRGTASWQLHQIRYMRPFSLPYNCVCFKNPWGEAKGNWSWQFHQIRYMRTSVYHAIVAAYKTPEGKRRGTGSWQFHQIRAILDGLHFGIYTHWRRFKNQKLEKEARTLLSFWSDWWAFWSTYPISSGCHQISTGRLNCSSMTIACSWRACSHFPGCNMMFIGQHHVQNEHGIKLHIDYGSEIPW